MNYKEASIIVISLLECVSQQTYLKTMQNIILPIQYFILTTPFILFTVTNYYLKMVAASNQLVWEVVKNNNCFMKKVNGRSKRSGTMRFSVEKSNLLSLSSYKHSGIASTQAVGIASKNDAAVMYTKTASKSAGTFTIAETPINKPFAKVVGTVQKTLVDTYYRPDLKKDALAKFSAVYQANRRAKGIKKTVPSKKGRGKK